MSSVHSSPHFGPLLIVLLFTVRFTPANAASPDDNLRAIRQKWMHYTTKSYKKAAVESVLEDVNQLVLDLDLAEKRPLAIADLTEIRIEPPFTADHGGAFGCISSQRYNYCASKNDKLCYITRIFDGGGPGKAADLALLKTKYARPNSEINTNTAYRLARQWLMKASIDVAALERDSVTEIDVMHLGNQFVPLYQIRWLQPHDTTEKAMEPNQGDEAVAFVEFLEPGMELRSLRVSSPEYIKRKALVVGKRDQLLQQSDDEESRKMWLTTDAYKRVSLDLMLKEVNHICVDLHLPEQLPIQQAGLTEIMIETPFFSDKLQRFATICTSNYVYGAQANNSLSYINRNYRNRDESRFLHAIKLKYSAPTSQANTNAAYSLAKRYMQLAGMDVTGLERDCQVSIRFWSCGTQFVPLYDIEWIKGQETVVATVQVLEPEGALEKLWVTDSEYIKRPKLFVTNRENLLK